MKKLLLVLLLILANNAYAKCDFKTGDYIEKLSNPKQISLIEINIPKSSTYTRNAFKIITLKSDHIPSKLKKSFKASLLVHYKFGKCKFSAKVKQSGDWKDHIKFMNAQVIRSLDVKLDQGNIINAVRFKLLLPETRNGVNEILASLILRKSGFISPETFEVQTSINGVDAVMLFQEKAAKELLEKHSRKEGPIFEGDESLIWSFKGHEHFELEPLALSRLVNDKWFKKGVSSEAITINAYEMLQKAYIKFAYAKLKGSSDFAIFPNNFQDKIFINYHSVLLAMNAQHGLRPHNRKYYFNTLEWTFEPIYYDGNVNLSLLAPLTEANKLLPYPPDDEFIQLLFSMKKNDELFDEFLKRVFVNKEKKTFFLSSMDQFQKNLKALKKNISIQQKKGNLQTINTDISIDWYQNFQKNKGVKQEILNNVFLEKNIYVGSFKNGKINELTTKELAQILSRNKWNNKRVVYVPSLNHEKKYLNEVKYIKLQNKTIKMSHTMRIEFDKDKKVIRFTQTNPTDWVLMSGGNFSNWQIYLKGMPYSTQDQTISTQRFNKFGLTGCLNIYDSLIDNTFFSITNGTCEDSINIIDSKGKEVILNVENALADALDVDFSKLSIKSLNVKTAGNDCFDVSGGKYVITKAKLDGCKDKAISIGEKSNFYADTISVTRSNIAVSAKDLSRAKILNMTAKDVALCAEVKQKKQEFGGANLFLEKIDCSASIDVDSESTYFSG